MFNDSDCYGHVHGGGVYAVVAVVVVVDAAVADW